VAEIFLTQFNFQFFYKLCWRKEILFTEFKIEINEYNAAQFSAAKNNFNWHFKFFLTGGIISKKVLRRANLCQV